jgi:hypothetical protein
VQYHRRTLPGDASWIKLSGLQPDTSYTASLTPKSNQDYLNTLSANFTTLPGERAGGRETGRGGRGDGKKGIGIDVFTLFNNLLCKIIYFIFLSSPSPLLPVLSSHTP